MQMTIKVHCEFWVCALFLHLSHLEIESPAPFTILNADRGRSGYTLHDYRVRIDIVRAADHRSMEPRYFCDRPIGSCVSGAVGYTVLHSNPFALERRC